MIKDDLPTYAIVAYRGKKTGNIFSIEGLPFSKLGKALKRDPFWINEAVLEEGYITIILGVAETQTEALKLTKAARSLYTPVKGASTDLELFKMNKITNNLIVKDEEAIRALSPLPKGSQIRKTLDMYEDFVTAKNTVALYSLKTNSFIGDVMGISDLYRRFSDHLDKDAPLNYPNKENPVAYNTKSQLILIYHNNQEKL